MAPAAIGRCYQVAKRSLQVVEGIGVPSEQQTLIDQLDANSLPSTTIPKSPQTLLHRATTDKGRKRVWGSHC
jgi:hypothetical protein